MSFTPLNRALYSALQRVFVRVEVVAPGIEASVDPQFLRDGKIQLSSRGETYRVNCPFCSFSGQPDTRMRLWINHRWGYGFPEFRVSDKMWWAAKCFHNDCMQHEARREQLRFMLFDTSSRSIAGGMHVPATSNKPRGLVEVELPGRCIPLNELPENHFARSYWLSRNFDPDYLASEFGISFCEFVDDPHLSKVAGRTIIPCYLGGKLIGWQARYMGTHVSKKQPKYYTCPGFQRRYYLYGIDQALGYKGCVLVEGVTDCWSMGCGSLALLGSSMSLPQLQLIARNWDIVVIVLDGNAIKAMQTIQHQLEGEVDTVVPVCLPAGCDPDSMRESVVPFIREGLSRKGVSIEDFVAYERRVFSTDRRGTIRHSSRSTRHG